MANEAHVDHPRTGPSLSTGLTGPVLTPATCRALDRSALCTGARDSSVPESLPATSPCTTGSGLPSWAHKHICRKAGTKEPTRVRSSSQGECGDCAPLLQGQRNPGREGGQVATAPNQLAMPDVPTPWSRTPLSTPAWIPLKRLGRQSLAPLCSWPIG